MFLGVLIEEMNLGRIGWGIMIGWAIWCILVPIILEILRLLLGVNEKNDAYKVDENDDSSQRSPSPTKKVYKRIVSFY